MLRTEGIVLKEMRYKDTSKILNVYTRKYGKIHVMARGAYRPKSILIANTQAFSYNEYLFHKGKSFYYLNQASIINSFYSIRDNVERFIYGCYILELVEKSTPEEEASEKLFLLLVKALETLSRMEKDFLKFSLAFGFKYISFLGYRPNLRDCVHCGNMDLYKIRFSHIEGGIICKNCFSIDPSAKSIDSSSYKAIEQLLYTSFDDLDKIQIDQNILIKLQELLDEYILYNIDRKEFNSLKMLRSMM